MIKTCQLVLLKNITRLIRLTILMSYKDSGSYLWRSVWNGFT